ncbi:hypothetical protein J3E69DRAFT_335167 [Trichoderma sp. SZMC 28015]
MKYQFGQELMADIFRFLGTHSERFPKCYAKCVHFCKITSIANATSWNTWNGFRRLLGLMESVERLTRDTRMLHCPWAPYLVMAIAMQEVILHDQLGENDKVSIFLRDFDCQNKAATAIFFYEMDYHQEILTLDQKWNVTPFAIQRPPNKIRNQFDTEALNQPMPTSRNQAPNEVIILDDEQDTVKRESPIAHQSPGHRHEFREEEAARPVPVPVPVPMSTSIPFPMPVPAQVPAQITMPISVPNPAPTSVLPLRPTMIRETLKEVFREDIMMQLQPLLDRLKSENWNGIIQEDIKRVLTEKNVRVLPSLAKNMLNMWATRSHNGVLLSWLEQARDDVDVFQWTERFTEPAAPAWTNPQSAHSVFHDLDAIIARVPQLDLRGLLQAKMSTLRDIFDQQEKSHKEEMLHRVDSLQVDIAKLHGEMAASKQMYGQAVAEPAAAEDDDAETDEEFAVHIIEAKKRKGEKKERKRDKKDGEEKVKKDKKKKTKSGEDIKKKKRYHHEMELD